MRSAALLLLLSLGCASPESPHVGMSELVDWVEHRAESAGEE